MEIQCSERQVPSTSHEPIAKWGMQSTPGRLSTNQKCISRESSQAMYSTIGPLMHERITSCFAQATSSKCERDRCMHGHVQIRSSKKSNCVLLFWNFSEWAKQFSVSRLAHQQPAANCLSFRARHYPASGISIAKAHDKRNWCISSCRFGSKKSTLSKTQQKIH